MMRLASRARSRQVVRCSGIGPAGRVAEGGGGQADLPRLLVHRVGELLLGAGDRLGEHHAGVVAGLHDHAADQRLDRHRGADLRRTSCCRPCARRARSPAAPRRASAAPASACRRPCTWSSASTWRTAASAHPRSSPAAPHRCRSRSRRPAWRRCRAGRAAWTPAPRAARPAWTRRCRRRLAACRRAAAPPGRKPAMAGAARKRAPPQRQAGAASGGGGGRDRRGAAYPKRSRGVFTSLDTLS